MPFEQKVRAELGLKEMMGRTNRQKIAIFTFFATNQPTSGGVKLSRFVAETCPIMINRI